MTDTELRVAAADLARLAAQTIDWLQGYDVAEPLEELGGAIVRVRQALEWESPA